MHLIRTAEPRPEVQSWSYALPGDSIVPLLERIVVHVEEGRVVELDTPPDHQRTSSCCGLTRGEDWADVEWSPDGASLAFVSTSRDYRTVTLRVADPSTGFVRTVLSESHPIFFESHAGGRGLPNWRVLHDRGEVLWFSQRDGWGHLFRYDLESGEERGRVTGGDWNVMDVLDVEESDGSLLFTAVGRESELTLLLIDALIDANKDFDVMVFPNRGHGYAGEAYNVRITWDYFVRHLLGKEPPPGYRIGR